MEEARGATRLLGPGSTCCPTCRPLHPKPLRRRFRLVGWGAPREGGGRGSDSRLPGLLTVDPVRLCVLSLPVVLLGLVGFGVGGLFYELFRCTVSAARLCHGAKGEGAAKGEAGEAGEAGAGGQAGQAGYRPVGF